MLLLQLQTKEDFKTKGHKRKSVKKEEFETMSMPVVVPIEKQKLCAQNYRLNKHSVKAVKPAPPWSAKCVGVRGSGAVHNDNDNSRVAQIGRSARSFFCARTKHTHTHTRRKTRKKKKNHLKTTIWKQPFARRIRKRRGRKKDQSFFFFSCSKGNACGLCFCVTNQGRFSSVRWSRIKHSISCSLSQLRQS